MKIRQIVKHPDFITIAMVLAIAVPLTLVLGPTVWTFLAELPAHILNLF